MPEPAPEAWAQIRNDYEQTDKPLAHICAEHDVTVPTVRYRMKVWAWNNSLSVAQQSFIMRKHGAKIELIDNIKAMFVKKKAQE